MNVVALIVARNEGEYIYRVISALKEQTQPISEIVLVDDGSTDGTLSIGMELGCSVLSLPFHKENLVGTPDLAERWNKGLEIVEKFSSDYVLMMGGDHVLPHDYLEKLISKMSDKIVIASGYIEGHGYAENAPRGSGRLVKASFWIDANNMRYPLSYGWESWFLFKAMEMGFETRCFREITSRIERATTIKNVNSGKGMYALGYDWKYVMVRCGVTFLRSPISGFKMFWGWINHADVERLDIADFVGKMQNTRFWERLRARI